MSILAHVLRALAVLWGILTLFWLALPLLQIIGGIYEGGEAFIVGFVFAFISAVLAGVSFACYRYTRRGKVATLQLTLIWCFVIAAGLLGLALVVRIL